jgi:hypothetical protein
MIPPRVNIQPAKIKTPNLFCEIQINPGTLDTIDARTLPAPIATKVAGKAQQSRVLKELNNVKKWKNFS